MKFPELPLVHRELLESAQHRRTYALRCLILTILAVVFFTVYMERQSQSTRVLDMMGSGQELSTVLIVSLCVTIYALGPAMACAAITSEKEKQTLSLLLISRLTPMEIVLEKISSRMIPMLSLFVVSAPLFGVAYLMGGISFWTTAFACLLLLLALFQVVAAAVFCSALLENGISAFFTTYVVLALLYFTWPVLHEMEIIPRLEVWPFLIRSASTLFRVAPPISGNRDAWNLPDEEFMFFPVYQMAMLIDFGRAGTTTPLLMVPTLLTAIAFVGAARMAVVKFSYGAAFSFKKILLKWKLKFTVIARHVLSHFPVVRASAGIPAEPASADDAPISNARQPPAYLPVAWRELQGISVSSWKLHVAIIAALVVLELLLLSGYQNDREEFSALFAIGGLITGLLIVMALSSRLFALERERQTLDALLTTPLKTSEILRQKLSGVNRLILVLLVLLACFNVLNLFFTDVKVFDPGARSQVPGRSWYRYEVRYLQPFDGTWILVSIRFLFCSLGCAYVYMQLVKWVAVWFGVRQKTQMKAMLSAILTICGLCFLPLLIAVPIMILADSDPSVFPPFFFISPIFVPAFNEIHELYEVYRRSWFPSSDWLVVLVNLGIYGGMAWGAKWYAVRSIPRLLQRPDISVTHQGVVIPRVAEPAICGNEASQVI